MRKNTVFLIIYEIMTYLAPLITAPYIARVLGPSGTGVYSYTYSIASYFILFIQLGVSLYGRREIAFRTNKLNVSKCFWDIFSANTFTFIITSIFYWLFILIIPQDYKLQLSIQYLLLISSWLDISWLFFGLEKFKTAVLKNIVVKILSMILTFVFIKEPTDTNNYILIMALANLFSSMAIWTQIRKHILPPHKKTITIKEHLRGMFILFLPILAMQLYSVTDKVCLGLMNDIGEVGIYENVFKISRVPVAIITAIGTVMLPRITNMLAKGKQKESVRYIEKSLSLTIILGSACTFGLIAIAPQFVTLYLGEKFTSGVTVLQILSGVLLVLSWGNVFRMQYILPNKMDKLYLKSVVAGAIINIILNIVLIPPYASTGAAIASLISELTVCVYQSIAIKDEFDMKRLLAQNCKYVCSGIIMAIIICIISTEVNINPIANLILEISVGSISYVLTAVLFECKSSQKTLRDELKRLKGKIKCLGRTSHVS